MINIVNGFGETAGAALVAHPDVDKIAFTGHVDTAKIIQKAAADTLKRTHVRAGRQEPERHLRRLPTWSRPSPGAFHAIYFHGGQCCTAGSRLFVEEKIHKEFVERLAEKAKEPQARRPARPDDRAGPAGLAGAARQDPRLRRPRPEAGRQARRPAASASASKGFFVEPTIFDNVKDDMAIARDEIFGPVVSVLPFKGVDEVIDRANSTHYGLAAGDLDEGHRQGPPATPRR